MSKLNIKHICGYLPYGLEIEFRYFGHDAQTYLLTPLMLMEWVTSKGAMKPLLYPLSHLTKEIEHKGEKFVPCDRLVEIGLAPSGIEYDEEDDAFNIGKYEGCLFYEIYEVFELNYNIVQKLYEWHFDIQGLIEQGLAIDKTLKV